MASPGSGLSASPDRKEQDEPEANPMQPTAGFARMRVCVRVCVHVNMHMRMHACMRTLDVHMRACMQCDP